MIITDLLLKPHSSADGVDPDLLVEARFWVDTDRIDPERVKNVLGRLWKSTTMTDEMLHLCGIISVIADDPQSWEKVQVALGANADPALGVLAYIRLQMATKDPKRLASWFFLVEKAAALGSFDAQLALAFAKLPKNMLLRKIVWWLKLVRLGIKAVFISARDPADQRLLLVRRNKKAHGLYRSIRAGRPVLE